ncbi:heme-degrading domain-containing protein [Glaciihabitans sp. UYNi722]|uniref:heme-degrading domain-containing protein n=1 Tax=Glaciihabitans sp. UYNi722 TaxID=3156344 RepID=UPI003392632D
MSEVSDHISTVEDQERAVVFVSFDNDDAWHLGQRFVSVAQERRLPITIDIARGEQCLFHCAMPGTSAHNDVWIQRKKKTVREFAASSYLVGLRYPITDAHTIEDAPWMNSHDFTSSGGGFPIVIKDSGMLGTVAVSGLRHADDHALVLEVLREFISG